MKHGDKPFPWRCVNCLRLAVVPVTIRYKTDCLVGGVLRNVEIDNFVVPKCSICGHMIFCNSTDEQINRAIEGV